MTDEVEELLRVLGPFYELVDEKKKITQISDLSTGTNKHRAERSFTLTGFFMRCFNLFV